jgi:hypothetical protein
MLLFIWVSELCATDHALPNSPRDALHFQEPAWLALSVLPLPAHSRFQMLTVQIQKSGSSQAAQESMKELPPSIKGTALPASTQPNLSQPSRRWERPFHHRQWRAPSMYGQQRRASQPRPNQGFHFPDPVSQLPVVQEADETLNVVRPIAPCLAVPYTESAP